MAEVGYTVLRERVRQSSRPARSTGPDEDWGPNEDRIGTLSAGIVQAVSKLPISALQPAGARGKGQGGGGEETAWTMPAEEPTDAILRRGPNPRPARSAGRQEVRVLAERLCASAEACPAIEAYRGAVGMVGAGQPQAVALGDMTNVAARLQSAAAPGTIVTGEETAQRLMPRFVLEPMGELALKGRAAPVSAWRVLRRKTTGRDHTQSPLVGREAEAARLRGAADDLLAGRGQSLLLIGDAGIGSRASSASCARTSAPT